MSKENNKIMTRTVTPGELREMLKEGKVKFQYTKKDGSVRTAVGTVKTDLITVKPAGGYNPAKAAGYSIYFDLEKEQFRAYADSKLIGVVED